MVQLFWIVSNYNDKETTLNVKLKEALKSASYQVENTATCWEMYSRIKIQPGNGFYVSKQALIPQTELFAKSSPDTIPLFIKNPEGNDVKVYPFNTLTFTRYPTLADIHIKFTYLLNEKPVADTQKIATGAVESLTSPKFREKWLDKRPPEEKFNVHFLDSLIGHYLKEIPFQGNYYWGIKSNKEKNWVYLHNNAPLSSLAKSNIAVPFLEDHFMGEGYSLNLHVTGISKALFFTIIPSLAVSVLVVLLLIISFWIFVRFIFKQKQISDLKNDFINNMTHEFNTPISSIALASETLLENSIIKKQPELNSIASIIVNENDRLRKNVETVLNAARLEKQLMPVRLCTMDLEKIISKVVDNREILLKEKNASVKLTLKAASHKILGDITHLENVLFNLLDNAIKYSGDRPEISIETQSFHKKLEIKIIDKGMGIASQNLKRIFDPFYRVPTGNLHNTKGFGIGLSYVKTIMDAHGAEIKMESQIGKGTTCILRFDQHEFIA